MFWNRLKHKDLILTVVTILMISTIGFKIIDNFPYFFKIIQKILSLSSPFFYGLVIAYILNPLVKFIEKRVNSKREIAILITYALLFGIVTFIAIYFIPIIVNSSLEIAKVIPDYITKMQTWVYEFLSKEEVKGIITTTGNLDNINDLITKFGTMAIGVLEGYVTHIFSISSQFIKLIIGVLISIYVLIDKDKFIKGSKRIAFIILKPQRAERLIEGVRIYHKMIGSYIGIKAIDSAIIGILAFILLNIVNSEYAALLAVIVGFTNMIPYFGPFIGEIVGLLFNIFVSPVKGITVFLVLLGLQIFDGWYLDPKLIGKKVGLRPFFIILGVVIGGGFYGTIGMLLASPTVATINIYYIRMLKKHKDLIEIADKA